MREKLDYFLIGFLREQRAFEVTKKKKNGDWAPSDILRPFRCCPWGDFSFSCKLSSCIYSNLNSISTVVQSSSKFTYVCSSRMYIELHEIHDRWDQSNIHVSSPLHADRSIRCFSDSTKRLVWPDQCVQNRSPTSERGNSMNFVQVPAAVQSPYFSWLICQVGCLFGSYW